MIGIGTTAYQVINAVQAIKSAMNATEVTSLGALVAAKWADVAATAAMLAPYNRYCGGNSSSSGRGHLLL